MKQLDNLWVKNSEGHFGYSVQKKIYLSTGNSLDFDWEKGQWRNWNEEGYNKYSESVGWRRGGLDVIRYEELPMNLRDSSMGELPTQLRVGIIQNIIYRGMYSFLLAENCRL